MPGRRGEMRTVGRREMPKCDSGGQGREMEKGGKERESRDIV